MRTKRRHEHLSCIVIMIIAIGIMTGCKPTEKNYKSAYDAAKAKREYVDPDQALLTGGHALLTDDATNWVVVGSDSLQLMRDRLSPIAEGGWPAEGPYRLAIAMFKMSTNANSLSSDLKKEKGVTPIVAKDGEGSYYIIVGNATSPEGLSSSLENFKKNNPAFDYIGLVPPRPKVIFSY